MRLTHEGANREGYWSKAKKQELINRLAQYEDMGEPEEIKFLVSRNLDNVVEQLKEIQSLLEEGEKE